MTKVELFNKLLAEEYLQWYSYFQASRLVVGPKNIRLRDQLHMMSYDELEDHASKLATRMFDLGIENLLVTPNLWSQATPNHPSFNYDNIVDFVQKSIDSEQAAINSYNEALEWLNQNCPEDTTSINMIEDIKADEEEHLHHLNLIKSEFNLL